MDYLLVGVNIDRQAVWCVHYWHCVFIRCVGGYIIVYMSKKKMFLGFWNACKQKIIVRGGGDFGVFGAPHAPTRGSRGVGKQYTSSYDHDMWSVKILERSGLAVKSYHPETLAAEE